MERQLASLKQVRQKVGFGQGLSRAEGSDSLQPGPSSRD